MNVYSLELARIPLTTLKVMMRLARTLLRDKPQASNVVIDKSAAKLAQVVEQIRSELVRRHQAEDSRLNSSIVTYDHAVDGLWVALRRGLERQQAFLHAGLAQLPAELAEAGQLPALRARAELANQLWQRLFSVEGTTFTKTKLFEQAESMATLLKLIEQDQLRSALESVLSKEEVELLYACQQHYERLLNERLSEAGRPNLNKLRTKLRWALIAYVNAVHGLIDIDEPDTQQLVLDALRPILTLRSLLTRNVSDTSLDEELEDFVDAGLPEADEQAELDEPDESEQANELPEAEDEAELDEDDAA